MTEGFTPWPAERARRYRDAGHWLGRPLGTLLRERAAERPAHTALVAGERRYDYAALDTWADEIAAGLIGLGLAAGDRLLVQLDNRAEFVPLCFAAFRTGVVPVLIPPSHRIAELDALAGLSGAAGYVIPGAGGFDYREQAAELRRRQPGVRHVVVAGEPYGDGEGTVHLTDLPHPAEAAGRPEPAPDGIAVLLLSGGTTGTPKLIPRTHDDYHYNARASADVTRLGPEDVYLAALPVTHNFTLACPGVLGTLSAGGTVVLAPSPSPEDCLALIGRERVTVTATVPSMVPLWLEEAEVGRYDLTSLRLLQVGGAVLAPRQAAAVRPGLGCALQQVFGMAEGLLNFTRLDDPEERVLATQGRPLSPDDEVHVVDEDGGPVPPGEAGELLTRGPYTINGYYREPERNLSSFTPDGFFRSGDVVRRDADGCLTVVGRVKDQINRGGEKIAAAELEAHVAAHDGVRHVAVIGVSDEALGERVCVCVVPDGTPPTLRALKRFLRERGASTLLAPDRLEILDDLPLTAIGKVDKKALAARYAPVLD
ncbi:AMP-binding protein [Streptomyces sp. NPDC047002]|uniref:(2,3-dihydroxybenzoyl)adenylate synthase n=1 Tax=Streptomyces sp. NPDC047002 TaxID=3155475 RepID=UPI003456693D